MIRADGGRVLLTAQAAGQLLHTVVNNTGIIEARTIASHQGTISLLGDMQDGTVNVGGTLDASAPRGGDGGFIETSAAHVNIADGAKITTAALSGTTGTWLIDPLDFTIGGADGNISGATLSALLVTNSVDHQHPARARRHSPRHAADHARSARPTPAMATSTSTSRSPGSPRPNTTTLTLNAERDVNINAAITATNGNFVVCCGRDVNVNAAITTTNGSILLNAGAECERLPTC